MNDQLYFFAILLKQQIQSLKILYSTVEPLQSISQQIQYRKQTINNPIQINLTCPQLIKQNKIMGSCVQPKQPLRSLPINPHIKDQPTQFIPVQALQSHLSPIFFVLPLNYEKFQLQYGNYLRDLLNPLQITIFRSRQDLKQYRQDGRNNILVVECAQVDDAVQIGSLPNFHTFTQIAIACNPNLIAKMNQKCKAKLGFRFIKAIELTMSQITSFFQQAKIGRSLYFYHADQGLINRANLIIDYFYRSKNYDSELFKEWAKQNTSRQQVRQLEEMLRYHASHQQWVDFMLANCLNERSLVFKIFDLIKRTSNPRILVYTAWPSSFLFNFIRNSYPLIKEAIRQRSSLKYIVKKIMTKSEADLLERSQGQNFIFSSFTVGQIGQGQRASFIQGSSLVQYKFIIEIPKDISEYNPEVDLGFYFNRDKVVFNLQNSYYLASVDKEAKTATVRYCSMGPVYNIRLKDQRYQKVQTDPAFWRMVKLYERYYHNRLQVRSIRDLIFSLQFYQTFKSLPSSKNMFQRLGDCMMMSQQMRSAQALYDKLNENLRIVKKLYLFYEFDFRDGILTTILQAERYRLANPRRISLKDSAFQIYFAVGKLLQGLQVEADQIIKDIKLTQVYEKLSAKQGFYKWDIDCLALFLLQSEVRIKIQRALNGEHSQEAEEKEFTKIATYFDGVHIFWI